MIEKYQDSLERLITGMIFGLSDHELNDNQVTGVARILNRLKMEDYMVLASNVAEEKFDAVKRTLSKLGVKKFKGFPTVESRTPKSRNPMAVHARRRRHGIEDSKKKADQKDPWGRGAKHKDNNMKKVEESVLGMTNVPMVNRMRELAGIKTPATTSPVSEKYQKLRHIRELEDFDDIQTFDDSLGSEMGADAPPPAPVTPVGGGFPQADLATAGDDFGDDGFADDGYADDGLGPDVGIEDDGFDDGMGMDDAVPGDDLNIPSFSSTLAPGVGAPAPVSMNTPAYDAIMSGLDQITAQLKDVKVSEYKEIINRLKSVHQEIRNQGFNYLQESKYLKKRVSEAGPPPGFKHKPGAGYIPVNFPKELTAAGYTEDDFAFARTYKQMKEEALFTFGEPWTGCMYYQVPEGFWYNDGVDPNAHEPGGRAWQNIPKGMKIAK